MNIATVLSTLGAYNDIENLMLLCTPGSYAYIVPLLL